MAGVDSDSHFEEYRKRWDLVPDGEPIETPYSRLHPVRFEGKPAMLKIAWAEEERAGAKLMAWWAGDGAAEVYALDGEALLLERATGEMSLVEMARDEADDEATRIICRAAARLHAAGDRPLPDLVPLSRWFDALWPVADERSGLFRLAADLARRLIAEEREQVVLHGDLHHGNILDFGARGWLAIDPKGLHGERTFDFVNLLRNPDAGVALKPGRFDRQVELISRIANLDRERFLEWTVAFTCLSAAWIVDDGDEPQLDLAVARLAASHLGIG